LRARIAIISAAALIGAAAFAFAGEQSEPEKNCDGSTYDIVECLKAKTAEWDKRMTIAYQQALKNAEPKQRAMLVTAQKLWIQFRDANCDYYDLGPGTIASIKAGYCVKDLTETRARELESYTERH